MIYIKVLTFSLLIFSSLALSFPCFHFQKSINLIEEAQMGQKASFKNSYRERKVAETDAKSCIICFKPSTSVLITDNSKDWFHVCSSHLNDTNFCTVVYEDGEGISKKAEHAGLSRKESTLMRKIKRLELELESSRSSLNKVKGYFNWGKKKTEDSEKSSNEGKDEKESDKSKKDEDKDNDNDNVEAQLKVLKGEKLLDLKKELTTFEKQYKRYRLDQIFYRNRLLLDYKKQKRAQIRKSLENGTLFPSLDSLPALPKQETQPGNGNGNAIN